VGYADDQEDVTPMSELAGSRTLANLAEAFAVESQANHRFLWFAQLADVDGRPAAAGLFRSLADDQTSRAVGHLEFLADVGDPVTGDPIGETDDNLRAAIAGLSSGNALAYSASARIARDEGFDDVAAWFDTLARADPKHVERLSDGLDAR